MTKPAASFLAQATYEPEALARTFRRLLHPLGGMERFVSPGATVVLKPNLVFGRAADKAINTHPEVVRAVARLVREAGAGRVLVGDSPGFGTARMAMKAAGILPVADEEGLEVVEFTPAEDRDGGRLFQRLELARELLEADVVVNLAKMKTHGQMLMSLAVKNLFGAVPGARKLQWHYRAGRDRLLFARVLNEIAARINPALNILDAVVGMDELGPTAGRARRVGFLAASDNAWSLDAGVMDVLGIGRDVLFTLAAARQFGPAGWDDFQWFGDAAETLRPDDWRIPELVTLQMHGGFVERRLPALGKWLRRRIAPRPVAGAGCAACGYCVDICPAKAMSLKNGRLLIDEAACIRCFCCHELCQHQGIDVVGGGMLSWLLALGKKG